MFVDVCYPKENEEKFIEIAKKLGTSSILFVYRDRNIIRAKDSSNIKRYYGLLEKGNTDISVAATGKKIHIFNPQDLAPFTQVHAKEIASSGWLVLFSSASLKLANKESIKRTSLMFKLCCKYKIKTAISSCVSTPYLLRAKKELYSMSVSAGMNETQAKDAIFGLNEYLESSPSAIFL